ncbi:hypothetical protein ABZ929_29815, partial [Streptomyces physcomitrii]
RKAPVESLMPLRLARYGVPLAETAPSGLAAAGLDGNGRPLADTRPSAPALPAAADPPRSPEAARLPQPPEPAAAARDFAPGAKLPTAPSPLAAPAAAVTPAAAPGEPDPADPAPESSWETWEDFYFEAFTRYVTEQGTHPTAYQLTWYLRERYGVTDPMGNPLHESELAGHLHDFKQRHPLTATAPADQDGTLAEEPAPSY